MAIVNLLNLCFMVNRSIGAWSDRISAWNGSEMYALAVNPPKSSKSAAGEAFLESKIRSLSMLAFR
jgi:hypothetical protein